jgi:innexin
LFSHAHHHAAICFYVPRYLWKTWEGGRIKMLVLDLNCPVVNDESKEERKKILLDYFAENLNRHNFYAFRFFICEALNFINVFVQIYFMDYFLGGEFSTYGSDVLSFTEMEPEERGDPMSRVFPKVTKCTFHKYGPSGSVQKFDGELKLLLCLLNSQLLCLFEHGWQCYSL